MVLTSNPKIKLAKNTSSPSSFGKLGDEHIGHLNNIATGGLMRVITPDHVANDLIQRGYIRRGIGGLIVTDSGQHALMQSQKD